jgi:hypothetical protein
MAWSKKVCEEIAESFIKRQGPHLKHVSIELQMGLLDSLILNVVCAQNKRQVNLDKLELMRNVVFGIVCERLNWLAHPLVPKA